jgi:DNA-binding transcriptional ArsR family regulator
MAKVLISLSDNLVRRIDRAVRERGLTRSAYITQLAERDLEQEVGPGADPAVHAALARLRELFAANPIAEDSTDAVRRMRDERTQYLIDRESQ